MRYRRLGNSTLNVSVITFGCWELGGGGKWEKKSDDTNMEVIGIAWNHGINTYDSAVNYGDGHSEEIIGIALKNIFREKRNECIVTTKVRPNNLRPADVRKSIEGSLSRLNSGYIDILYIHWPNNEIPLKDTLSEFNRLKEEKLIKAIGVSNFSINQLKEALLYAQIDVVQQEYSLLQRSMEKEILPFCLNNSISLTSYSSVAKGILTGVYHLDGVQIKPEDFRSKRRLFIPEHMEMEKELIYLLKDIAENKGATLSQIAISWILHQEGMTSAIVGTQNRRHLMDNIKAIDIALSSNELDALDKASRNVLSYIDK